MGVNRAPLRVLITGAAGHIGLRLAEHLASQPDIQLRLATRNETRKHISDYGEVVTGDLTDANFCMMLLADCTAVINLASVSTQSAVESIAVHHHDRMITNLLQAAEMNRVHRFIHLSSIHVFGSKLHGVITETTPIAPATPYGRAHAHGEKLILQAIADAATRSDTSCDHLILRCANGFGASKSTASSPWSLITGDLCLQAVAGTSLRLNTHGAHQRDFITISDIVRAVAYFLLQSPQTGLVLLGSGTSVTLLELAQLIATRASAMFGRKYSIHADKDDMSPPTRYQLDIRHLHEAGFAPSNDVNHEIDMLLAAAQKHLGL